MMMASLDPLGMPVATQVVSGESADDGLYIPMFDQEARDFRDIGTPVGRGL